MILGIDWYQTFTSNPELYMKLIRRADKFYIISAIREKNVDTLKDQLKQYGIADHLVPVIFEDYLDVPKLKYEAAKDLGLDLYIDDRQDVCQYFIEHGILATLAVAVTPEVKEDKPKMIVHHTFEEAKAYNQRLK